MIRVTPRKLPKNSAKRRRDDKTMKIAREIDPEGAYGPKSAYFMTIFRFSGLLGRKTQ